MKYITALVAAFALGCAEKGPPPNRTESPEAALNAARYALSAKDLAGFFDAVTEGYARSLMENTIAECVYQKNPMVAARAKPFPGCEEILTRYGWPQDLKKGPQEFQNAVNGIKDPRGLVVALESSRGTKYAKNFLDLEVKNLVVTGRSAKGTAVWKSGRVSPIVFEKDETGWRVNPLPEP